MFGTPVAETILASVHVRAHRQAGHMDARDLIKTLQNALRGEGRPHMNHAAENANIGGRTATKPSWTCRRLWHGSQPAREAGLGRGPEPGSVQRVTRFGR
jgi:hypothetical protein